LLIKNDARARRIQAQNNLSEEGQNAIGRYGDIMGMSDLINEALTEKGDLPDDAVEYKVFVCDAATGQTKEGEFHFKDRVDL
jgi:hypothetical protein